MASGSERLKEFEGREYEEDIDLAVRILVNRSVGFRLVQSRCVHQKASEQFPALMRR